MRRTIGAGLALAVGGVLAGAAFAGTVSVPGLPTISTPTLPTVSTPTVPTITSPVPLPPPPVKPPPVPPPPVKPPPVPPPPVKPPPPAPLPPAPKPPQPPTVSVPLPTSTTPAKTGSAPKTTTGATSSGATASGSGAPSGSSSGTSASSSSSSGSTPQSGGLVQVGRGPHQGSAVIRFIAPSAARAFVTVKQLFPSCAPVGHFSVRTHAGVNNVRFAGRVHGRKLQPGTYRFTVRARSGRLLRRMILVVVKGPKPTGRALAALRSANACTAETEGSGFSSTASAAVTAQTPETGQPAEAGVLPAAHGANLHSGVLASAAEKTARALEPLLIALLVASILLFGVASLPREAVPGPRLHDALAQHRLELAGLGAAALVAAVLAFLLT
jgi:hypothetical protein